MKKTLTQEQFEQLLQETQYCGIEGEIIHNDDGTITIDDTPDYQIINENTIYELKQKLFNTDYVINKITEAQLLGNSVSAILSQYKDIIDQRQAWRDEINKLEAQNNELKINN